MRAAKKVGLVLFAAFAVAAISNPDMTDAAASILGVGRGADLLLYFVTIALLFSSLNGYLRSLDAEQRLVELARQVTFLQRRLDDVCGDSSSDL